MGAAHQELPQHLVALLGDAFLGVPVSRAAGGGHEPQVRPYGAALLETVGILHGEHEGERRERPDPLDLAQEIGFGVAFFGDGFQSSIVVPDALGERADLLDDGSQGRPKRPGDVLGRSFVEAPCRALGQAGSGPSLRRTPSRPTPL